MLNNPVSFMDPFGLDIFATRFSFGARFAVKGQAGPLRVSANYDLGSYHGGTDSTGSTVKQGVSGGIGLVKPLSVSASTGRSAPQSRLITSAPDLYNVVVESLAGISMSPTNYSGSASKNKGKMKLGNDNVLAIGAALGIGLEFELNLTELGRAIGIGLHDLLSNGCR